ncbi:MAG TPA: aminotransferase class I/II-fold pyridoxal phosphate-dependent enzyme [Thermoanaerobaculia bacterium]|nr:aminotransferase class I/II-fold pyridoxal phosphate-dependent enzyme [Thermoanaerobaculia bacterium]
MPDLSRRSFTQLLTTAAAAAAMPAPVLARTTPTPSVVRLSSNENPFGPSPAALASMREAFPLVCRYPDDEADALVAALAKLHGVPASQVLIGAGSGELLRVAALAFTGPQRHLVTADPTFEALGQHSRSIGAEVRAVPLDARFAHDAGRMSEASRGAGLVYICNPNNPTATITPDKHVRELIGAVPPQTMVLVDEAYHHYVLSPEYKSVVDLASRQSNVIVLRTFSKIYGMAGLRCGYAVASEDVIRKMRVHQMWDTVNVLAAVAARTSLADQRHVAEHRKLNEQTRTWVAGQMRAHGHDVLPSEANFVMIDVGREVRPLILAMRGRGVHVGRVFPAMPKHLRVTIGKVEEMKRFVEAFKAAAS